MKKIFVIRKFVAADTLTEALEQDPKTPVHDCFMDDHSQKLMADELVEKKGK